MTVQAARKGMASGSKRKQRRRRGAPAATNVSTSELQDLYNERQVRGIAPNFQAWACMCIMSAAGLFIIRSDAHSASRTGSATSHIALL